MTQRVLVPYYTEYLLQWGKLQGFLVQFPDRIPPGADAIVKGSVSSVLGDLRSQSLNGAMLGVNLHNYKIF